MLHVRPVEDCTEAVVGGAGRLVLGIETSCDETAAAVVRGGNQIVSNVVASQVDVHRAYGGVVPELASRQHLRGIIPVVDAALQQASVGLEDLTGVAVTRGPGLVGALLVGVQTAKALAYVHRLPLIGVNHLEGHLCAARLTGSAPPQRHLALLVSGGHTALLGVERFGSYTLFGTTRDDAAGEAFDKVAKMLGLGYPGGPAVERAAKGGDPHAVRLPRALPGDQLDFSFSGLKTAVLNVLRRNGQPHGDRQADLCASFQQAVSDVLVKKTQRAARKHRFTSVVAAGGVIANATIREEMNAMAAREDLELIVPPIALCTDNAAMIAAAGALRLAQGETSDWTLNAAARLPLASGTVE